MKRGSVHVDFKPRSQGPLHWKRGIVDFSGNKVCHNGEIIETEPCDVYNVEYMISYSTETCCRTEQLVTIQKTKK